MQLPPALAAAMAATKTAYFEPQYLALRDRLIDALAERRKARTDRQPVDPDHGRAPRRRRRRRRSRARRGQGTHRRRSIPRPSARWCCSSCCWLSRSRLTFGAMMAVTRRVIKPLHNMRDAMLKVAAGDLAVDTGYAAAPRRDRRAGRRAGNLQAAGRRQAPDRSAGARAQRRRRGAPAGDRRPCRRVREHGAPDAAATGRRLQPDAHDLVRACRRYRARPTSASRSPRGPPARPR